MICVFFIFCSMVFQGDVPVVDHAVSRFPALGIVLQAHNALDGRFFSEIEPGMMIRYWEGTWVDYRVIQVVKAQALAPDSLFTPLLISNVVYSPGEIHETIFSKDLVLVTCIEKDGNWSWGRLFVVAHRYTAPTHVIVKGR